jgi:integration host factor subunit beta
LRFSQLSIRLSIRNAAKQATEIIKLIFNGFTDTMKKGDRIEIRGFGSFTVREYKSYKGRNPKTGKNIDVRPKKLPFFKVGKDLKGMVNSLS